MIRKNIFVFLILLIGAFVQATDKVLDFNQNLTISDGLAHNGVTCILEDSKGYLWIGTYDGVSVYDGYEVVTYKNTIHNEILASNRVRSISEDSRENIWVGTDEGISIYNYETEEFIFLNSQKMFGSYKGGPVIRKIVVSKDGSRIFCLTENKGVLIFNDQYQLLSQNLPQGKFDELIFFDGLELDSLNYVFNTTEGIFSFKLDTRHFKLETPHEPGVTNAALLLRGEIILATRPRGVSVISFSKEEGQYRFNLKSVKYKQEQLNSLSIDKRDNLWLGTMFRGVVCINNVDDFILGNPYEVSRYSDDSENFRVSSIAANISTGCWVTTFNKGVYRFDVARKPFRRVDKKEWSSFNLYGNSISHIAVWDEDRVFISAIRGGVSLYNTRTDCIEPLPFNIPQKNVNISSIFVDRKKDIWLKATGGLGICRVRNGEREMISVDQEKYPVVRNIRPRTIAEDQFGNIWMGDENGVYKITLNRSRNVIDVEELSQHSFFKEQPIGLVRYVYADPLYNFIWIGTDTDGLIRIKNRKESQLSELEINRSLRNKNKEYSISSNFVSTILRLPNGDMWIGTERGGICKVLDSDSDPKFIAFTEKDGLSNNVVKRIFYDDQYNLWVATNVGLNKFYTKDNYFRCFYKSDGLPFEDFWYSFAMLDNGNVILSGVEGICSFKPKEIEDSERLPRLEFTNLKILNQSVNPKDTVNGRVILQKRLNSTKEIVLKYDENIFSIEASSLHFLSHNSHYIKFQLLPINENWIQVPSGQRIISYSGLSHGKYTLTVMASNSLHEWSEPKSLHIVIKPPFWKTPLAFIGYVVFVVFVVYIFVFFLLRLQSLKHNLKLEHFEKNKEKEISNAKLQFFSNISHEIKTPLTLISGPINILADRFKANVDVSDKLMIVIRQSKKISQLIDQVQDFYRMDNHLLKMNITQFCFNDFINDLKNDFAFLADTEDKTFEVESVEERIYVSADRDKLEKIINNLLNNAFKYTNKRGSIKIKYKHEERNLLVSISDTGKGIDPVDMPHVFERFYQSRKQQKSYFGGSGIGLAFSKRLVEMHYGDILVESELNVGSTFYLRLPIVMDSSDICSNVIIEEVLKSEKEIQLDSLPLSSYDINKTKVDGEFAHSSLFFVEDNFELRHFVGNVLEKFFKVRSFTNGQECVDAMQDDWPDIVVSDVLMPELNGFDLCKYIKSDFKTSHIPVILLTACTTINEKIQGLDLGADAYINKPFDMQHLITRIESLLRGRKQLRERYSIDLPLTLNKHDDSAKDTVFLEKLYQLMEKNIDNQNLDLDSFAKKLYLNRTHFFQKVKAVTNQTPYELLKNYRIKKAADLLVQEDVTVNEVYLMTGFKSRAHFNKLFKEKYEVTPGKYSLEVQNRYAK